MGWFADFLTHVGTADISKNVSAMLTGVLADATNFGPTRMVGASKGISAQRIGWMRTPGTHILAIGAMAQPPRPMANAFV